MTAQPETVQLPGSVRVFALSDVHTDFSGNRAWLQAIPSDQYNDSVLILAGDVSHNLDRIDATLECLLRKFAEVFFVPGNHELWIHGEESINSLEKFWHLIQRCESIGVRTHPVRIRAKDGCLAASAPQIAGKGNQTDHPKRRDHRDNTHGQPNDRGVWIVPLYSWYLKPEEGSNSLFVSKPGEDPELRAWSDNRYIRWPRGQDHEPTDCRPLMEQYFLDLNRPQLQRTYDAPVISFSHFLPRRELMFPTRDEYLTVSRLPSGHRDPNPRFNFSRVAGTTALDTQIRRLGSIIHVYGHQHRNRDRMIDGIHYVSHCLGYPVERSRGVVRGMDEGVREVWPGSSQTSG